MIAAARLPYVGVCAGVGEVETHTRLAITVKEFLAAEKF